MAPIGAEGPRLLRHCCQPPHLRLMGAVCEFKLQRILFSRHWSFINAEDIYTWHTPE